MDPAVLMIPVVAAIIGFGTNWLAVRMMFYPLEFRGVGWFGWQGVIPSRAAKMGSISVDRGLSKLGTLREFYEQLDPERLAAHVVSRSRDDITELVDEVLRREHPRLWAQLPPASRELIHKRVQATLPELVTGVTHDLGEGIEQLVDLKLMVVRQLEAEPELANRIFLDMGEREFRFIVNSGAWFGFALGLLQMGLWLALPQWWTLPLAGLAVGYATNWLALTIIFEPIEPKRIGPFEARGRLLLRQHEIAEVYARLVTERVLTLRNLVEEMLHGPQADRTRALVQARLAPAVDEAVGRVAPAVRFAVGSRRYDAISATIAAEGVEHAITPLTDETFNRERAAVLSGLIADRMRELPARDFAELLRSAFEEDEWRLIAVGAALGGLAGIAQSAVL